MCRTLCALLALMFPLVGQNAPDPADWREWLNKGVREFKNARYPEAVVSFQRAVDMNPSDAAARLYLGTAWMSQYIPGSDSPENLARAAQAEQEFNQAFLIDPANKVALASLASLSYNQKKFDDAKSWYGKLLVVDPQNKEAFYTLGVIAWTEWYPVYQTTRSRLGMKPEEPGPIPDVSARKDLKNQYGASLEEGISNLQKALAIDPRYDDAMAYINLLIRERADLLDSKEAYVQDITTADEWVRKAIETKKENTWARAGALPSPPQTPPPPPAPTPARRIRVGSATAAQLVQRVDPVYPPLAKQARIQGTVRLTLTIGADGHVNKITIISGHPLLIPAAMEAAHQWVYRPTLLNGEPVEVLTEAAVSFTLPPNE
jgi:TonB family protein